MHTFRQNKTPKSAQSTLDEAKKYNQLAETNFIFPLTTHRYISNLSLSLLVFSKLMGYFPEKHAVQKSLLG